MTPDTQYPAMPEPVDELAMEDGFNVIGAQPVFTADQLHAYADATCALRHPPAAAADAGVSDAEILQAWAGFSVWGFATNEDRIARARELLALRPAQIAHDATPHVTKAEESEREAARSEGFNAGTVAALAVLRLYDNEVQWREVLEAAGSGPVLQYAAHIEPEDWTWAGFDKYIGKKPKRDDAPARVNEAAGSGEAHAAWSAFERMECKRNEPQNAADTQVLRLFLMRAAGVGNFRPDLLARRAAPAQVTGAAEGLESIASIAKSLKDAADAAKGTFMGAFGGDGGLAQLAGMARDLEKHAAMLAAAPAHEAQGHGGVVRPIGHVESAMQGAGGFHVRLATGVDAPSVGAAVFLRAPAEAGSGQGAQEGGEREAFKAAHAHLELDEDLDAWHRRKFKHSHVQAMWEGWQKRAGAQSAASNGGALSLARTFHEAYERLAPEHGYTTRPDTRAFDPSSANGRLMVAVCTEVLAALATAPASDKARQSQGGGNG